MDGNKSSFWPSYVDIMTTLFAIMLVLFAVSYSRFKVKQKQLESIVKEYDNIVTVYSTVSSIDSTEYFGYNAQYLKHLFTIDVQYQDKQYSIFKLKLDTINKAQADLKRDSVKAAGELIVKTIKELEQKAEAAKDNNIKFLVIIEGQASKTTFINANDWENNYTLSYLRAQWLNKFWENNGVNIRKLKRCELIISGSGEGGVPRVIPNDEELRAKYPNKKDYWDHRKDIESQNQRFLVHIVPVIGNIDVRKERIDSLKLH